MSPTCPNGHDSETSDYCGTCGAALCPVGPGLSGNRTQIEVSGSRRAHGVPAPVPGLGSGPGSGSGPAKTSQCPNCGSKLQIQRVCGECGYDLDAPDSVASWEAQLWEVVVRPDREYFEMTDPGGMVFPASPHTRRQLLTGDYVRIGRRSTSKGIEPEIDLSGPLEDVGVSHRHAVLMRQPDGRWSLVDQDSTNGTYLNGGREPVTANAPVALCDGDQIHLGAWTTVTIERVEATAAPPFEVELQASKDTRAVARGGFSALAVGLLGPLQVTVAGDLIPIGASKARAALSLLALRIGSEVPVVDLEWALWGDEEPKTADKALQGYISTIRRLLPRGAIETTPRGYRLTGQKGAVDVFLFERRTARGRDLLASGHPGSAAAEIGRALELWRGEPVPDLADGPVGVTEVARLAERRATAEEDFYEARLQLGAHQDVIPDLSAAVVAEPLRERRWAQLMLALHRCGRQVDALRAFQRLRDQLGEHGLEPSAEISALERAIVLDKPELRWSPPSENGDTSGTPVHSGARRTSTTSS